MFKFFKLSLIVIMLFCSFFNAASFSESLGQATVKTESASSLQTDLENPAILKTVNPGFIEKYYRWAKTNQYQYDLTLPEYNKPWVTVEVRKTNEAIPAIFRGIQNEFLKQYDINRPIPSYIIQTFESIVLKGVDYTPQKIVPPWKIIHENVLKHPFYVVEAKITNITPYPLILFLDNRNPEGAWCRDCIMVDNRFTEIDFNYVVYGKDPNPFINTTKNGFFMLISPFDVAYDVIHYLPALPFVIYNMNKENKVVGDFVKTLKSPTPHGVEYHSAFGNADAYECMSLPPGGSIQYRFLSNLKPLPDKYPNINFSVLNPRIGGVQRVEYSFSK